MRVGPFEFSYNWTTWIGIRKNLLGMPYDLSRGIRNVIRWVPAIWFDRDYDWYHLAEIMDYKLRRMAKVSEHGHLVNGQRKAKQMRVCAELLRRMRGDGFEYIGQEHEQSPDALRSYRGELLLMQERETQDVRYLGRLIGKHFTHWWD